MLFTTFSVNIGNCTVHWNVSASGCDVAEPWQLKVQIAWSWRQEYWSNGRTAYQEPLCSSRFSCLASLSFFPLARRTYAAGSGSQKVNVWHPVQGTSSDCCCIQMYIKCTVTQGSALYCKVTDISSALLQPLNLLAGNLFLAQWPHLTLFQSDDRGASYLTGSSLCVAINWPPLHRAAILKKLSVSQIIKKVSIFMKTECLLLCSEEPHEPHLLSLVPIFICHFMNIPSYASTLLVSTIQSSLIVLQ